MNPQIKDHFYDQFLKEPTKTIFGIYEKSCGELNERILKRLWNRQRSVGKNYVGYGK